MSTTACDTAATPAPIDAAPDVVITGRLTLLFSVAVGTIIVNLSASQTLIGVIGPALGLSVGQSGLIATVSLLGYALGMFLLVPLADLLENRGLVVRLLSCAVVGAAASALAPTAASLLVALFALGAACAAIQILVPIAASMTAPEHRGRTIGNVMSGLMIGIVLSRPIASVVTDALGWRAFYGLSAAAVAVLTVVLARNLPRRVPAGRASYPALIASLWHLLRAEPVLRARALTAGLGMAAFTLFWTSIALRLVAPPFALDQRGVALFALVGAVGAAGTSIVGRIGDRGWTRPATVVSHLTIIVAFALAGWAGTTGSLGSIGALVVMALGAVLVDIGVTGDQTLGRRAVNLLRPEARGRLNGLFVGLFFFGGALGSALAGATWAAGGWMAITVLGMAIGLAALIAGLLGPAE
jgi:predicted MFS family arabinose efflux permease